MRDSFAVGQIVQLTADPSRRGPVIEVLPEVGGVRRYRVFHGGTDIREYDEPQLEPAPEATTPPAPSTPDEFLARLTAARLMHPLIDTLYSLYAARVRKVSFQFKPMLRLLRADRPRLLIADEVGVGKTIEGGLILKELEARQDVGNVLVVCPKSLVKKWRDEMRRFDEHFEMLDGDALRYCLSETDKDGVWPARYSRAIVHLELLRGEEYLGGPEKRQSFPGLVELDPPPRFGLLLVDEAHHVRNPGTRSHEVVRLLADLSEAVVFLSATPVHLGAKNLFALLNLLRPDIFQDEDVFRETAEPNPHITAAMRLVRGGRSHAAWQEEAARALDAAFATRHGRRLLAENRALREWREALAASGATEHADRLRCLRDLEEAHSLAHVMNRTRRRDVGRFTLREPQTVSAAFSPEQRAFYEAVVEFRRELLREHHDELVVRLVTDTLERQAASCLPALLPVLDGFLRTGRFVAHSISDDDDRDGDEDAAIPPRLREQATELRALAAQLPAADAKLDLLYRIVGETLANDGPRKLLVFSFFRHTLAYLLDRLRERGVRVAMITGDTPEEDEPGRPGRLTLRDRFRLPRTDPDAVDVLLSSEVGAEGLDYEFCDRLVNYDIPWNPMRIEQRIGRIDRFGQLADKVLIYNFVTPGTVEERVFHRCFERLGIFRDTVGDLEEVLGGVVEELTRVALDPGLTPEQAQARADQMADNLLRRVEEQRRLETEGGGLLGLDNLREEFDEVEATGRFIAPADLWQMIARFIERPPLEGALTGQPGGTGKLRLSQAARLALRDLIAGDRRQPGGRELARWLDGDNQYLELTFDPQAAVERRSLPFVTPLHPLARAAARHWSSQPGELLASLRVTGEEHAKGRYAFVCDLWQAHAVEADLQLVTWAWNIDQQRPAPELARGLLRLFASAGPGGEVDPAVLEAAFRSLEALGFQERTAAIAKLRERNSLVIERRLASLDAHRDHRVDRIDKELDRAANAKIRRMKESERQRVVAEHARRRAEIEAKRVADLTSHRLARGVLEIVSHAK